MSGSLEDNLHGLKAATFFGAKEVFDVLMNINDIRESVRSIMISEDSKPKLELLADVVKAENTEMLRILLNLCPSVPNGLLQIAEHQKHVGISSLISVSSVKLKEEAKIEKTKQAVECGKTDIFKVIPRDTEYDTYEISKIEMIKPLLNGQSVPYQTLLEKLVVP